MLEQNFQLSKKQKSFDFSKEKNRELLSDGNAGFKIESTEEKNQKG